MFGGQPLRRGAPALITLVACGLASGVSGAAPAPASTPTAPSLYGAIALASTSSSGVKATGGQSNLPSIAASGQAVAFFSSAPNLDPNDPDAILDVFVKDLHTGVLTLASTTAAGVKGNSLSTFPELSADGTAVAFESASTNFDATDNGVADAYVKNVATGDLTLVSTSDSGVMGNGVSGLHLGISRTGNRVVFMSVANNLDPGDIDSFEDVYLKKLSSSDTVLLSTKKSGVKGNRQSDDGTLSASGGIAAFSSESTNLNPADSDAFSDVYVKTIKSGLLKLASQSTAGVKGDDRSFDPSLSGNGAKVAFDSIADNLDPADTDTGDDIYVKEVGTGEMTLASTSDDGVKGSGLSTAPSLSGDGKRVAFASTSTNLDPADTDPDPDIYVKNLVTGDIALVSTAADGIKGNGTSSNPTLSGKGNHVVFASQATNFDPGDADTTIDLYAKDVVSCTVVGTSGDDTLAGMSGDDVICGRGGNDTIDGGIGDDVLFGEGGDDDLTGGPGADAIAGGDDTDLLDYELSNGSVTVDLGTGAAIGGDADGDAFSQMENIEGGPQPDALTGDAGDNVLLGMGGDDILAGGPGADQLWGLGGIDVIDYETATHSVTVDLATGAASGGDASGDTLVQIEGVIGSPKGDTLTGDAGDNVFLGMAGSDTIDGGDGSDLANYVFSPAAVTVNINTGVTAGGDAAGDVLTNIERLAGSAFDDDLTGDGGPNQLFGEDGDDTLTGKGGDDTLVGAKGVDTFDGGDGTDSCDDVAGESVTKCE